MSYEASRRTVRCQMKAKLGLRLCTRSKKSLLIMIMKEIWIAFAKSKRTYSVTRLKTISLVRLRSFRTIHIRKAAEDRIWAQLDEQLRGSLCSPRNQSQLGLVSRGDVGHDSYGTSDTLILDQTRRQMHENSFKAIFMHNRHSHIFRGFRRPRPDNSTSLNPIQNL